MKQHLNRKNVCVAIEDDIDIEEIKKYYGFGKKPIMTQKDPEMTQKDPKMTPKNPEIDPIEPNKLDPEKPQKTQFCPKKSLKTPKNPK